MTKETLIKSNLPRSSGNTSATGFDTLRSEKRVPKFRIFAFDMFTNLVMHAVLLTVFAVRAFSAAPAYYERSRFRCPDPVIRFDIFSVQDVFIVILLAAAGGVVISAMERSLERKHGTSLREYMLFVILPSGAATLGAASALSARVIRVYTDFLSSQPHVPPVSYAGNKYAYVILVPLVMIAASSVITLVFLWVNRCMRRKA